MNDTTPLTAADLQTADSATADPLPLEGALPQGWQCKTLGEIASISSGGTPSRTKANFWGGDIPWLTTSAINFNTIYKPSEMITEEGLKSSATKIFPADSLLMAMYGQGATRGRVALMGFPAAINQACAAIQPKREVQARFLFYSLSHHYERIRTIGHGGNQKNLNAGLIRSILIALPPLPEQRAIVEILNAADDTIRKTQALLNAKLRYKRALAELLLTGKRRFPEFAGSGEWREVVIGDVLTEVERPVIWDDNAFYNLLSVRRRSEGLFLRSVTQGKTIKTKRLKEAKAGDFLISKMQVVHGAWGTVPAKFDRYHVSDSYICLVAKEPQRVQAEFLGYLSQLKTMYSLALKCSHGVHIEKMTFKLEDFLRKTITLPPTLPEQQQIAECLSLMDEEIRLLQAQCEAHKRQKQGLMQRLLTGRVRLPAFRTADTADTTTAAESHPQ